MNDVSPLIHIVDDAPAVRDALALLIGTVGLRVACWLHPDAFVAALAGDEHGQALRDAVGAIVRDVRMPGASGFHVLERLQAMGADQPVVMLTGHGTVEMCRRAFKSGVSEFLEKPVDDERLLEALHQAVRAHAASRRRLQVDRDVRERVARLSPRERDILARVIEGQTAKQIARQLGLSPRTVETHRANLSAKLEAGSLAQLIRRYAAVLDDTPPDGGTA